MSPIAPRYRGPTPSSDRPQPALSPILTIPNLSPMEVESVAHSQVVSDDASPERIKAETSHPLEPDVESVAMDEGGIHPVLGSMQESIKRITDQATQSIKQVGNFHSFNPVETVRGVLPGIVISISIICLWWIIGRNSPAPLRQDLARESQSNQEMINPIADEPLRAAEQADVAAPDDATAVAADTNRDGQLFDNVPFINRPTNTSVSQREARQEAPTTVPPANEGPQAGSRPNPSHSGLPPATQHDLANARSPSAPIARSDVRRPNVPSREPADATDRSTEFEWPRDGASMAQRKANPQISNPPNDRGVVPPRDRQIATRTANREHSASRPQEPYSYQQTDPSTYKDPVYSVPPVARRARPAQR